MYVCMYIKECELNTANLTSSCLQCYQTTLVHLIEEGVGLLHSSSILL